MERHLPYQVLVICKNQDCPQYNQIFSKPYSYPLDEKWWECQGCSKKLNLCSFPYPVK